MCACICAYKRNNNPRVLLPLFVPISQLLNPSFFRAQASERVVYTAAHISIGIRPPRAPCALHPLGVRISVRGSGARPLNSECLRDNATRHEPSLRVEATCPVGEHYTGYIHIYRSGAPKVIVNGFKLLSTLLNALLFAPGLGSNELTFLRKELGACK